MKKSALIIILVLIALLATTSRAHATVLQQFSDTITTSRPSAATPLAADQTAGVGSATIVSDTQNYSVFIASDSASFYADSGETQDNGVNVASMSALNVPAAGERIVYFTNTITHAHHLGDVVAVPITAMHTIKFNTQTTLPANSKIIITFPGTGANTASPSATTFSFNGMSGASSSTIASNYISTNNASTCTWTVTAPTITCTTSAQIIGGTTITFLIGCKDNSTTDTSCTNQAPTLINPTKSTSNTASGATVNSTTADNWKVSVQTQDNNGVVQDQATTTIGIIESVQVQASVDPTLTFTITGIGNGVLLSSGHGSGCVDTTNSGIATTATFVNLGLLLHTKISLAAQDLSVATNEAAGYALTATASGHLTDVASGYSIRDTGLSAGTMTVGTEDFGIHACGTDANSSFVPAGGVCSDATCTTGSTGAVAWPTATSALSIASRTGITAGTVTTVEYAGTVSTTTPAGTYNAVITYVATPTFN